MDGAFHANERTWISTSYFRGQGEIDFLRKWSKPLSKSTLEDQCLQMTSSEGGSVAENLEETLKSPEPSKKKCRQDGGKNDCSEVVGAIKAMGDEFFAMVSGKVKKTRRRSKKSEVATEVEEEDSMIDENEDMHDESFGSDDDRGFTWSESDYGDEEMMFDSDSDDSESVDLDTMLEENKEKCNEFLRRYALLNLGPNYHLIEPITMSKAVENVENVFTPVGQLEYESNNTEEPIEHISGTDGSSGIAAGNGTSGTVDDNKDNGYLYLYGHKATEEFFENYQKNFIAKRDYELKHSPDNIHRLRVLRMVLGLSEKHFNAWESRIRLSLKELGSTPIVENAVAVGSVMPLLAPPVPLYALRMSTALAIYVNFASRPGPFQWKCRSVNEQISIDIEASMQTKKKEAITSCIETCDFAEKVDKSSDALFTFVLYHQSGTPLAPKSSEPEFSVKISILGSQPLQELRNKFYCKSDLICGEIKGDQLPTCEIDKDACMTVREANLNKPCAIFVGQTIYTNKACEGNKDWDYASALKVWASRVRKRPVGPFYNGSIEDTRIIDLTFKHGFPYLFIHQGNCEHLLVIDQVRLLNSLDSPLRSSYPAILKSNFKTVYCYVDNKRVARYAVRNMDGFPHDPMLVCRECLELYCYLRSKKVCDFKLFQFLQFSATF